MPDWQCNEGGSATGRHTVRNAFQGFRFARARLSRFGVPVFDFRTKPVTGSDYGHPRNLWARQIRAPRFVKVGIVNVPEPLSIG